MKAKCNCTMRTKLVGDGCEVCQPQTALEYYKATIEDLEAQLAESEKAREKAEKVALRFADDLKAALNEDDEDLEAAEAREAGLREALREVDHILSNTGGSDLGAIISAGICVDKALSNPSPRAEAIQKTLKTLETFFEDRPITWEKLKKLEQELKGVKECG